jgi:tetratricopeptide (TPR) repeat protein
VRSLRPFGVVVTLALTLLLPEISMSANATSLPDIDSLWDYNDPAATEAQFRALLPRVQAEGDADYEAELLTQLARTQGLQQKLDSAHAILDGVQPMLAKVGERASVRYMLERGRTYNSSGEKGKAASLFQEALDLASQEDLQTLAVDAAHMLAIAIPDEGMAWNLRALEMAEAATEPGARRWRGSLYNNLGWTYFGRDDYDSALTMFKQALICRQEQEEPREVLVARWCVAKTQRHLGNVEASLAAQEELEIAWNDLGEPDGYVFEESAECLLLLGRNEEARPYFGKAYEYLSKDGWLVRDEQDRLKRMSRLSQE